LDPYFFCFDVSAPNNWKRRKDENGDDKWEENNEVLVEAIVTGVCLPNNGGTTVITKTEDTMVVENLDDKALVVVVVVVETLDDKVVVVVGDRIAAGDTGKCFHWSAPLFLWHAMLCYAIILYGNWVFVVVPERGIFRQKTRPRLFRFSRSVPQGVVVSVRWAS
jgi:hypothetical protein